LLTTSVQKLEDEIGKADSSSVKKEKTRLVAVDTLKPKNFTHFIDLQGQIDALNIAFVSPRNAGGQVKAIYVKKGDYVKKGQLLLKLDDAVLARQLDQAKATMAYQQDLYTRRDNLWKENIGAQVDVINAKNALDMADKQVAIIKEQIDLTNVYADIDGVADEVNIRLGEFFTGNNQIRIVNTSDLKATVQVPENYLGMVHPGSNVNVILPELNNKTIHTRISVTGKIIDPNTRSFYAEAKIPPDKDFHPNQVALVKIQDYASTHALTVPINTLQTDEKGKYVLVAMKEGTRLIARKKPVQEGYTYGDRVEIKGGLDAGDVIITDGFQGLYDGQALELGA